MAKQGFIPTAAVEPLFAALLYCLCSNTMVLSNKAILSYFNFHYPLWLMAFQSLCTSLILEGGRHLGLNKCEKMNYVVAMRMLPVNLLFVAMICTAGLATQYLSVPFLTVFKNMTNIIITFGEQYFFGKEVSGGVIVSILLMALGSACAAVNDIEFSAAGYFWLFWNCLATAGYLLYIKFTMDSMKISKDNMALYNNALGFPLIFFLAICSEPHVTNFGEFHDGWFITLVSISGLAGFAMSLSSFYAMEKTSPTTYGMIGALNKIPASILGAIFFQAEISEGGWTGIAIGLFGGIVFAYVKSQETSKPPAPRIEPSSDQEEGNELLPRV
eukprot:c3891_g1_i1.p1 GENE.c3891_g1_i1~~c3891_g1_i1.p1  ORF type:complete len:329 (+),score=76.22 c3891_g1_i1:35-1021(+)